MPMPAQNLCRCGHHRSKHVDATGACRRDCECQAFGLPTRVEVDETFDVSLGEIAYADQIAFRKLDGHNQWYAQNEIPAATCRRCHEQLYRSFAFGRTVWRHKGKCPKPVEREVLINPDQPYILAK